MVLVGVAAAAVLSATMTLASGRTSAVDGGSDRVVIPEIAADGPVQ